MRGLERFRFRSAFPLVAGFLLLQCSASGPGTAPSIEFTKLPIAAEGGSGQTEVIEGRVHGARPGQQIVLFARSGVWWVQPLANQPFTTIRSNSTWSNTTHLGMEYAALLVDPGYRPPATTDTLPDQGGFVVAVATAKGTGGFDEPERKTLQFSGYEWEIRQRPSDRGGPGLYHPENAWTDPDGLLHLRIARRDGAWTSAEVFLTRSLGYGTYSVVVRDTSRLEPAAAFSMFTWDELGVEQNHREMNIEISHWGDPASKNAQYVVQPFYVPANVSRFTIPQGRLTHSFRWEPGRVRFRTVRGAVADPKSAVVAEHEFASGVPSPGGESIRMNFYYFGYSPLPLQNEAEVVIEKFEYLP